MKRIIAALVLGTALVACSKSPILDVEGGKIQGVNSEAKGVTVFKGIPYAAAPVGDLRWRLPQDVEPWDGVKVADTFSAMACQADLSDMDLYGKEFYADNTPEMSEDCLYLNVWAPTKSLGDVNANLPVAVWIHGGAFDHGWGFEKEFDGDAWAEKGVILVTINYRVGIFGFFAHPELTASEDGVSGNYGIYDQLKALQWVNENISAFGGDPYNVTVFGQSAGAMSIEYLVSSSETEGLISKVIMQSGAGISTEFQHPTHVGALEEDDAAFIEFAGYENIEQAKAASYEELMAKVDEYKAAGKSISFRPCLDFRLTTTSFTSAAAMGNVLDVPYMIGCNTGDGLARRNNIDQFCASRDYYDGEPVYEYLFSHDLPGDGRGAFHSAELWYMFGTLDRCWRPFTAEDEALSEEMLNAWTNFAKYGNPNGKTKGEEAWPAFTQAESYCKNFK